MHQQLRSRKWRERTINIKKEGQKERMNVNRKKERRRRKDRKKKQK